MADNNKRERQQSPEEKAVILRRHARNVFIAARKCDDTMAAIKNIPVEDDEHAAGIQNQIETETMKRECLIQAGEYMVEIANFLKELN